METYIVKQPIMDENKKLVAYEVLYQQDESSLYGRQQDITAANAIESFLTQINTDSFMDGKRVFMTFTPNLLMRNIPKMFQPKSLVIQIQDNSIVHPLAQKIIYRFKKQGYQVALDGFEFSPRYFGILDAVDIVKVDFATTKVNTVHNVVETCQKFGKDIFATRVDTEEAYEMAKTLKCKYIQGKCIGGSSKTKLHRMDHMQSNFFQLMVAVTKDEPDMDEITTIISRDVTLAFSLMKLVNSTYFALRNRVSSVKQALIILGLGQLKQWIYLLSLRNEDGGESEYLIRTSFLRANFAQELAANVSDIAASKSEIYLMGMFSTLGELLEVPLESALGELSVSDEIKNALLYQEGRCGSLYKLILCYEQANWNGISKHAEELGIPLHTITQIYFNCVESVNEIWNSLHSPATTIKEDEDGDLSVDAGLQEAIRERGNR